MTGTNPNHPDLIVRVTDFQATASSNFTRIDFKVSGFDIDRDNLTVITFFNLRWRSLPEVIESVNHKVHHRAGQILPCYIGAVGLS
jgi:uncharacterized lipoprotein